MITPPDGLNLFVRSGVASMLMLDVAKAALRWRGILPIFLITVTYILWRSTLLLTLVMWPELVVR